MAATVPPDSGADGLGTGPPPARVGPMMRRSTTTATISADDLGEGELSDLLALTPQRAKWLEFAAKQGAAASIAFVLSGFLPDHHTAAWIGPATAVTVMQSSGGGTLRRALDTLGVTMAGVVFGVAFEHLLGLTPLSVLLTLVITVAVCRPLPLSADAIALVALNALFSGTMSEKLAFARVSESLLGGLVALSILFLFPQRVPIASARNSVSEWAESVRSALDSAARWLDHPEDGPFRGYSPARQGARKVARHRVNDMSDAVRSQWIRRGSDESRQLVRLAYEALARIPVYTASSLYLLEQLSAQLGDTPYAQSRRELAAVLREIGEAVVLRAAGDEPGDTDAEELDADLDRLARTATDAITSRRPMAWEAMALLTNIQAVRGICRQQLSPT